MRNAAGAVVGTKRMHGYPKHYNLRGSFDKFQFPIGRAVGAQSRRGEQMRPYLSLTCDVANLTNAHQVQYRGIPDQMALDRNSGTTVTFGISGRF
jgi:hypothetical protein